MTGFAPGMILQERYRLERPLGEGGMGSVWVACQIALQREVAIKVLLRESEERRVRLRREALALAAVHHPNVVPIHDYGELDDGTPFLVMELVRGELLTAHLARVGRLRAPDAVRLILPLLDALVAVHAAGIVHRDIKPDNVILAASPAGVVPKLLDFGIAAPAVDSRDAPAGVEGTPSYMAPEQARAEPTDARADVWAAAAMLYEAIAGVAPFTGSDVATVIQRVLEAPPPFPRHARELDGRLWAILMGGLRKEPEQRTPSAAAFRADLVRWLEAHVEEPGDALPSPSLPPIASGATLTTTLPAAATLERERPRSAPRDAASAEFEALIRKKLGG